MDLKRPKYIYLATLLWWLGIWVASSIPTKHLPSVKVWDLDKLIHIAVYLVLALLINRSLKLLRIRRRTGVLIYLAVLISAALDEYHQYLIPGRSVSVWDLLANGVGLGIGFTLYLVRHDRG